MRRLASKTLQRRYQYQIKGKATGLLHVRVMGVHGDLILGGITDQTFGVRERDI